jgi:hypothetical protein
MSATKKHPVDISGLQKMFCPEAVAVIGVSKDPSKLGSLTLRNVINGGFAGKIFPIGRDLVEIHGLKGYPGIAATPQPADLVFMALPADRTTAAAAAAAAAAIMLMPGSLPPDHAAFFSDRNIPLLTDTDTCLQGIAALLTPPPTGVPEIRATAPAIPAINGAMSEPDCLALLGQFEVSAVSLSRCSSADAAVAGICTRRRRAA